MPSFLHPCMTLLHARPVEDLQFPLMRHWTLYDAMIHSPYLAVRLHTWQAKGQRRVETLLTKMGLPLRDCRRQYCALLMLPPSACPSAVIAHDSNVKVWPSHQQNSNILFFKEHASQPRPIPRTSASSPDFKPLNHNHNWWQAGRQAQWPVAMHLSPVYTFLIKKRELCMARHKAAYVARPG